MSEKNNGGVFSYTHFNHKFVGVVALTCETDFAARTDLFKSLGNQLASHVAFSEAQNMEDLLSEENIFSDLSIQKLLDEANKTLKEKVTIKTFTRFVF